MAVGGHSFNTIIIDVPKIILLRIPTVLILDIGSLPLTIIF